MKKRVFIIVHILVLVAIILCSCVEHQPAQETTLYSKTTVVSEVDRENDVVVCADCNGDLWAFKGCEGWKKGDFASLIMNACNTENIYDDEIVKVNYCGNVKGLH